jgi:hypothetical protein
MSEAARPRLSPQHLDLALTVAPLLDILTGDKRERLRRAFVGSANHLGILIMNEGRLPLNAKEAALALHRACLDLALRAGVSRIELTTDYNDHGEHGTFLNGGVGDAAERCLALLAIFYARRLVHAEDAEPRT